MGPGDSADGTGGASGAGLAGRDSGAGAGSPVSARHGPRHGRRRRVAPSDAGGGGAGDRVCRGAGHVERAGGAEGSRGRAGPIRGRAGLAPDA